MSCVENTFDTWIYVLMDEIQAYKWMNVTWILHLPTLLIFLFFQIDQIDQMGVFLLEDMYFLLEAKGLSDNGYFFINQFDYTNQFDN